MRITLEGSVGSVGMGGGRNISDREPEPDGVELDRSAVTGIVEYIRKSGHKMLLLSQKISCGETALIIPGDVLRRRNYGSWNIFPFHFVFYMNRRERCFHTANPT